MRQGRYGAGVLHPIFPADPVAKPPPFSSQQKSRTLSMPQGRSGAGIRPSHIPRRPRNQAPAILVATGIQNPFHAPRPLKAPESAHPIFPADPVAMPPPFSSQRESRALSMPQDRYGAGIRPSHIPRRSRSQPPAILVAAKIESPFYAPGPLWRRGPPSHIPCGPRSQTPAVLVAAKIQNPFYAPRPFWRRNSPIPYSPQIP